MIMESSTYESDPTITIRKFYQYRPLDCFLHVLCFKYWRLQLFVIVGDMIPFLLTLVLTVRHFVSGKHLRQRTLDSVCDWLLLCFSTNELWMELEIMHNILKNAEQDVDSNCLLNSIFFNSIFLKPELNRQTIKKVRFHTAWLASPSEKASHSWQHVYDLRNQARTCWVKTQHSPFIFNENLCGPVVAITAHVASANTFFQWFPRMWAQWTTWLDVVIYMRLTFTAQPCWLSLQRCLA